MIEIERGEVYYVNFRSILGSEQGGNRPCVVIQNDIGNIHSGTTIIAPMTTQTKKRLPTHVPISFEDKLLHPSTIILLEQIRVVDKRRIGNYVCRLSDETMERVDKAIEISLALHKKEERSEKPMNEIVVINDHTIKAKEFNGQRVVTFKDIDMVHERTEGTAGRKFRDNKDKFIENEDFFI